MSRAFTLFRVLPLVLSWLVVSVGGVRAEGAPPAASKFRVTIDPAVLGEAYSGRLYVALAAGAGGARGEPRQAMGDWNGGTQVFSLDVSELKAGESVEIGANAGGFPKAYADLAAGEFRAQAVARRNPDACTPGDSEGDLYSAAVPVSFSRDDAGVLELRIDKAAGAKKFKETERIKVLDVPSPSLSKFLGRPFTMHAGVMLPKGWSDDGAKTYQTIYFISGFGSDHRSIGGIGRGLLDRPDVPDTIVVLPDPTCYWGHSVFADSENTGPWGKAFTEELIPAIEAKFHAAAKASKRYLTGISSGGWSSLWLMVTYPEMFAGCWSHCPDPVDFRDFQRIDIYAKGANMFRDEQNQRRPLARQGGKVSIWYDDFVRQETVMGPGGQIGSFEAVFGPRENGRPRPLFDRATGAIDPVTAKAWEKYDIRLVLERNWAVLGPKLKGKIHVYAGGEDTFYLEGAAKRLKASLMELGSDAKVEIFDGLPHTVIPEGIQDMFEAVKAGAGGK